MAEPLPAHFLKFEDGDGREIPLSSGNVWKIGRNEQNNVVLPDDMVPRCHAMIQFEGRDFYLIDMGSRNGSFVNGCRLTAPVLYAKATVCRLEKRRYTMAGREGEDFGLERRIQVESVSLPSERTAPGRLIVPHRFHAEPLGPSR